MGWTDAGINWVPTKFWHYARRCHILFWLKRTKTYNKISFLTEWLKLCVVFSKEFLNIHTLRLHTLFFPTCDNNILLNSNFVWVSPWILKRTLYFCSRLRDTLVLCFIGRGLLLIIWSREYPLPLGRDNLKGSLTSLWISPGPRQEKWLWLFH